MSNKPEVISKDFRDFGLAADFIVSQIKEGYSVVANKTRLIGVRRYLVVMQLSELFDAAPTPKVVVEDVVEVVVEEEATLDGLAPTVDELDSLTKKAELLKFASDHDLDVPSGLVQPSAIKKYLRDLI